MKALYNRLSSIALGLGISLIAITGVSLITVICIVVNIVRYGVIYLVMKIFIERLLGIDIDGMLF